MSHNDEHQKLKYSKDFTKPKKGGSFKQALPSAIHNAMYIAIEQLEFVQRDARTIGEKKIEENIIKMINGLQVMRKYTRNKYFETKENTKYRSTD